MVDVKLGFQDLSNNKRIALFYELLFCLQFVWFNLKLLGAKIYTFIETNERRGSAAVFYVDRNMEAYMIQNVSGIHLTHGYKKILHNNITSDILATMTLGYNWVS